MRRRLSTTLVMAALLVLGAVYLVGRRDSARPLAASPSLSTGMGSVATLEANYRRWESEHLQNGGDRNVVLPVGWFKGLSTERATAQGSVRLDLVDGTVSADIVGLPKEPGWDLWLFDNGAGRTIAPEPEDARILAGSLKHGARSARLEARLGHRAFEHFEPDIVVINRSGLDPTVSRALVGTTTLFQRLHRGQRKDDAGLVYRSRVVAPKAPGFSALLSQELMPTARAQMGPIPNPSTPLQQLITEGRSIFLNETFDGNGRTCATCHRENNNFSIDPQFIATLPADDPLFVGENNPDLGPLFENPRLLREFGLIVENVDGFDDLANKFVNRGVPTLLAVSLSLKANTADGTTIPPNERLGYGGDGAPGTGTLREFAIGAVFQHFTKTLNRTVGTDFRLPTDFELDAMEAFQRSLGRQAELNLAALQLKSAVAARGQAIFRSPATGKCFFCHSNGGASLDSGPGQGVNANFNIGVQALPDQPADLTGEPDPPDAGFGRAPHPLGGFGNGTFNTLALVEAADTGPFFHNNSVATIESAVEFYNSTAFNTAPIPPGLRIHLESTQVAAVAAFLRVINSLENIRSTVDLAERAKIAEDHQQAKELLSLALPEVDDAIDVLKEGLLHQDAQSKLQRARVHLVFAIFVSWSQVLRNAAINKALPLLQAARDDMAVP